MVYVSGGKVVDSRSPWRISIIPDFFWGIINFIVLFFTTMYNPSATKAGNNHVSDYRKPGGGGPPPGPPRRRMGGFRGGGGAPDAPPMAGGG